MRIAEMYILCVRSVESMCMHVLRVRGSCGTGYRRMFLSYAAIPFFAA